MNYSKIYESLILKAKNRDLDGYYENHHIVPRCMGGTDDSNNLVRLTPEEHYVAHQLLIKMNPGNHKLVKAAAMMIPDRPSNKLYGWLKRQLSIAQSLCQKGKRNSQYYTKWITNGSEERKISADLPTPEGWVNGRGSIVRKLKRQERLNSEKNEKLKAKQQRELIRTSKIKELRDFHAIYVKYGFSGVKNAGYKYSRPNLVAAFAKYLPEFVPQNGKPRISID